MMKDKISVKTVVCLILFLGGLIYGATTLQLIGHRPPIIFITLGVAILGLGLMFFYSIKGKRPENFKKVVMIAVVLLAAYGITEMVCNQKYQEQVAAMQDWDVDLNTVEDGTYIGTSDVGYIKAEVKVKIKDHIIKDIKLVKHINERGTPAEKIVDVIVQQQKVDVDAVSSATNSSKVIKTAVKNALLQGVR
ncbi:MAG: FMN-binding protein [Pseudobutyrivibrio sp.]|nr:FMN-binding protein [Pseudobutyrivibrio sp.]